METFEIGAVDQVIAIAARHAAVNSSAALRLADAHFWRATTASATDIAGAALASLSHSVGPFHPDFVTAARLVGQL